MEGLQSSPKTAQKKRNSLILLVLSAAVIVHPALRV